jgi:hypothetical protein
VLDMKTAICVLGFAAALQSTPAMANQFAGVPVPYDAQPAVSWIRDADGTGGTLSAAGPATLEFSLWNWQPSSPPIQFSATFTLEATTFPVAPDGTPYSNGLDQGGLFGTFSFIYAGSDPFIFNGVEHYAGANLLSGKFSGADLQMDADRTGWLLASNLPGSLRGLSYTSDLLNFGDQTYRAFNIGLETPSQVSAPEGKSPNNFTGGLYTLSFSSAVPEPATWAMLICGLGLLGGALRRRRRRSMSGGVGAVAAV